MRNYRQPSLYSLAILISGRLIIESERNTGIHGISDSLESDLHKPVPAEVRSKEFEMMEREHKQNEIRITLLLRANKPEVSEIDRMLSSIEGKNIRRRFQIPKSKSSFPKASPPRNPRYRH
jgi:hypothetical protein